MTQVKTVRTHASYFINMVAKPMEPIHAELLRLATELEAARGLVQMELEAVRGQVQTELEALRDLSARTTTAMSGSGSQHDRRLNHREAGRHLPRQFVEVVSTMETLRFGWMAVLQSYHVMDRVVRCCEKWPSWKSLMGTRLKPWSESCWMSNGEVATLVRRLLSVSHGHGLQAWHIVTQWFKPRSVVEQAASMARLISPKRTKNVTELQVAVMQRELTLVEHESKVLRGGS